MNEFSGDELKIHQALFNNENNEYSDKLKSLQSALRHSPEISLPTFAEISRKQRGKFPVFRLQMPFYAAAAAILLILGGTIVLFRSNGRQSATIAAVRGNSVQLDRQTQVKIDTTVGPGQIITTGEGSSADIIFKEGTSIRILENSLVLFKKLHTSTDSEEIVLEMTRGNMLLHIHKKKKNSGFSLLTPFAGITVRGTKFLVKVDAKDMKVAVKEGRVAVAAIGPAPEGEQVIEPMQQITVLENGFKRQPVTAEQLTELDAIATLAMAPVKKIASGKTYASEKEISTEFKRLEKVILIDGTFYTGAIIDMDETSMIIQTIKGEIRVDRHKIVEVDQLQ